MPKRMYLVRLSIITLVVVTVVEAGPLHTVSTVTGTSTDGLNSTVQVRLGEDPAIIVPTGRVTVTLDGPGTEVRKIIIISVGTLCLIY